MASRIGGGSPPPFTPPASAGIGATSDNRLEQMRERQLKELLEQRTVRTRDEGEHVLNSVVKSLKNRDADPNAQGLRVAPAAPDGTPVGSKRLENRPERAPSAPTAPGGQGSPSGAATTSGANELPRLVADFQRQNGLPVTGRLDTSTVSALKDRGLIPPQASGPPAPAKESAPTPRAGRDDVAAARQTRAAAEQQTKQRVGDGAQTPRSERPSRGERPERTERSEGARDPHVDTRGDRGVDRVVDPARLLASLFAAGFAGKGKASLDDAIKAFQTAQGLPVTGKLDAQTQESLKSAGVVDPEHASPKATTDKPVEPKQQVRRALTDAAPTTKNAADRDVNRDPLRPQASTNQQTTSAEVAARAPVTSSSDAAQSARLDTVMAQQAATERGVQEGTGDPTATHGHGEVEGIGAGLQGTGGTSGGGVEGKGQGAIGDVDGPEGEETAVGNAEAGDDDFNDAERGNANSDGDRPGDEGEYWQVPPLSGQVHAALEAIARDDDGSGPVTYTWDVTFMRPGTYAAGQPAEELWHVAVKQATAFDPVWQQAADAISSRMLYGEPDADPPTLDDFIMALRRARVR